MEEIFSSETLVDFQPTTRPYIPEDSILYFVSEYIDSVCYNSAPEYWSVLHVRPSTPILGKLVLDFREWTAVEMWLRTKDCLQSYTCGNVWR
jgi:hypothetical protein